MSMSVYPGDKATLFKEVLTSIFRQTRLPDDIYLWIRMHKAGIRFANLPAPLVNVRVAKDMYARRGGSISRVKHKYNIICTLMA